MADLFFCRYLDRENGHQKLLILPPEIPHNHVSIESFCPWNEEEISQPPILSTYFPLTK